MEKTKEFFKRIGFWIACWIVHIVLGTYDYCVGVYNQIKLRRQ